MARCVPRIVARASSTATAARFLASRASRLDMSAPTRMLANRFRENQERSAPLRGGRCARLGMPLHAEHEAGLVLERLDQSVGGDSAREQARSQTIDALMVTGCDGDLVDPEVLTQSRRCQHNGVP